MTTIALEKCTRCGACLEECPSIVLAPQDDKTPWVKYPGFCTVCGHCAAICPTGAITVEGLSPDRFTTVGAGLPPESVRNHLLARRSTRVFSDRPVSRDLIQQLIECGTHAGTASNAQSEGFIVIQEAKVLSDLNNLVLEGFWNAGLKYMGSSVGRALVRARYGPEISKQIAQYYSIFKKRREGEVPATSVFRNAPAVIVTHGLRKNNLSMTNAAIATRNMEIMAVSLGMGTCWMGFLVVAAQMDKKIGRFLSLTPDRNVFAAITVGFPKREYKRTIPRRARNIRWI